MQACEGLTNSYTKISTPTTFSYTYETPFVIGNPVKFTFSLVKGLTHIYPNGINFPFAATDFFWEFFNQVSTSNTVESINSLNECNIFPNPVSEQMIIDVGGIKDIVNYDILVYNIMGPQVFISKDNIEKQYILSKEKTGSGLFIIHIRSNHKQITRRIKFE